jgi:hypothetical protein
MFIPKIKYKEMQEDCHTELFSSRYKNQLNNYALMRFQVLTTVSTKFRFVFWDVLPCKIIVDRRFRGTCCHHYRPDDGRQHLPLKRRSTIILHCSIS